MGGTQPPLNEGLGRSVIKAAAKLADRGAGLREYFGLAFRRGPLGRGADRGASAGGPRLTRH